MHLTYFDIKSDKGLIEEIFQLVFEENDIPFTSSILPIGLCVISYNNNHKHEAMLNNITFSIKNLTLSGQFYNAYQILVSSNGTLLGTSFHPTALYKILEVDMFQFYNRHASLKEVNLNFFEALNTKYKAQTASFEEKALSIEEMINNLPLKIDATVKNIDIIIDIIRSKDGLLNVSDILAKVPMSKRTLENQFKKIVGMTPGKYIRLWRFLKLMRKYESGKIKLNDLIQMYDYYDHSHFAKDFQVFMKESPTSYFQKDNHLLHQYLKE